MRNNEMVPMIGLTNEVLSFMFKLSTFLWQSSRLVIESVIIKINTFFFQLCVHSFWGNIPLFSTKISYLVLVFLLVSFYLNKQWFILMHNTNSWFIFFYRIILKDFSCLSMILWFYIFVLRSMGSIISKLLSW